MSVQSFDHDRLDVYRAALEFVAFAENVVAILPRGRGYLIDQLQRAALSITLNIAEGAGEFSSKDKARFYRIAKRSSTECAAILDVCYQQKFINEEQLSSGREVLLRIVSMLISLVKGIESRDAASKMDEGRGRT